MINYNNSNTQQIKRNISYTYIILLQQQLFILSLAVTLTLSLSLCLSLKSTVRSFNSIKLMKKKRINNDENYFNSYYRFSYLYYYFEFIYYILPLFCFKLTKSYVFFDSLFSFFSLYLSSFYALLHTRRCQR